MQLLRVSASILVAGLACADDVKWSQFTGRWTYDRIEERGEYPWAEETRFPTSMDISIVGNKVTVSFSDQFEHRCTAIRAILDETNNQVVFKHCLPSKDPYWGSPYYVARIVKDKLIIDVRSYKTLFEVHAARTRAEKME